jgi:hypothetical protein
VGTRISENSINLTVLPQSGTTNGSETCGFHSLKNAFALLAFCHTKDVSILERLSDRNHYEELYSLWRPLIPVQCGEDATVSVILDILEKREFIPTEVVNLFEDNPPYHVLTVANMCDGRFAHSAGERMLPSIARLVKISQDDSKFVHLFVIGKNSGNSSGHFVCVAMQTENHIRRWITCDSMGGNAQDVVQELEQILKHGEEWIVSSYRDLVGEELSRRAEYVLQEPSSQEKEALDSENVKNRFTKSLEFAHKSGYWGLDCFSSERTNLELLEKYYSKSR